MCLNERGLNCKEESCLTRDNLTLLLQVDPQLSRVRVGGPFRLHQAVKTVNGALWYRNNSSHVNNAGKYYCLVPRETFVLQVTHQQYYCIYALFHFSACYKVDSINFVHSMHVTKTFKFFSISFDLSSFKVQRLFHSKQHTHIGSLYVIYN